MSKKVSRRDFARTSAASAAAVVAIPKALFGEVSTSASSTAAIGAAVAKDAIQRGRFAPPPPAFSYGGDANLGAEFRETIALAHHPAFAQSGAAAQPQQAGQSPIVVPALAPVVIRGWHEGMTIPAEYYIDEDQYLEDERFLARNLWFLADHEARIPKPGDYFLFQFGRGDSVIVLRDRANAVTRLPQRLPSPRVGAVPVRGAPDAQRCASVGQAARRQRQFAGVPLPVSRVDLRSRRQADFGAQRHAGRFQDGRLGHAPLSRADHRGVHLPELLADATPRSSTPSRGGSPPWRKTTGRRI